MGDFLSNLVSKSRGAAEGIRPRPLALFEATAAGEGLTSQLARPSDSGWRNTEGAAPIESTQRTRGESGPDASPAPRLTADGEPAPSATTPASTSHPDPKRPPRFQGSSLGPPRARPAPSPAEARSEVATRPAATVQLPAAPKSEGIPFTTTPPAARVPTASQFGPATPAIERGQTTVTRRARPTQPAPVSPAEALEADLPSQARDKTDRQDMPGTPQAPPDSHVQPIRPSPALSSAPTTSEFPPHRADESVGGSPPPQLLLPDSPSLSPQRSIIPLRPAVGPATSESPAPDGPAQASSGPADGAPRPRAIARFGPDQPLATGRQASAYRPPAESAPSHTFPSVEPPLAPSEPSRGREPAPTIQVTIGSVEVRAIAPPLREAPRPRATSPKSVLTLDEYLKQRNEESR